MDSGDLSAGRGGSQIPIVSTPTLALGLQSSIHAEGATTEQPTVSKAVSGSGLAVRIHGRFCNSSGLWRGRRKLGPAPTPSSNHCSDRHTVKRKCLTGKNVAAHCGGARTTSTSVELERERSGCWQHHFRNDFTRRSVHRPADLPVPANVRVIATSAADSASNASAQLIVTSDIVVGISSASTGVELGGKQSFAATLTSAGQPDTTVRWELSGSSCRRSFEASQPNCSHHQPFHAATRRTGHSEHICHRCYRRDS
jgi:hypothetical protein